MNKKKHKIVVISIFLCCAVAVLIGLILTGLYVGWGPFTYLQFEQQENAIIEKYDASSRQGEIVFYGASNFRLWTEMETDLAGYKVQNHGFGGSTDKDLIDRADTLLYPYLPSIVVFQTGSNDYVSLSGTDTEKVALCIQAKEEMFAAFHQQLPNAKFVVMSGLLLPGRSQYTALTQMVNDELEKLCAQYEYMIFVDAEQMTFDGVHYQKDLFISDGIHLNRKGQIIWGEQYIIPAIETVISEFSIKGVEHQ